MVKPWMNDEEAPNGKTVCENFRAWLDGNRLLERNGDPVVVFRGDSVQVTSFDREARREHGLFFAVEADRAAFYGEAKPYVVKASNPLDLRSVYGRWREGGPVREIVETLFSDHYEGEVNSSSGESYTVGDVIDAIENGYLWQMDGSGGFQMSAWRQLQRLVEGYGYDALIVHDTGEGIGMGTDYVVFAADQVKSLDANSGLFVRGSGCTIDHEAVLALRSARDAIDFVESSSPSAGVRP